MHRKTPLDGIFIDSQGLSNIWSTDRTMGTGHLKTIPDNNLNERFAVSSKATGFFKRMNKLFTSRFLFTLALSLLTVAAMAQGQAPAKGTGKITGTVMDSGTNQPVEFATVQLNDPATGKPVDGALCDDQGKFTISKVANGSYKLQISFIGYETYSQDVAISDRKSTIELGTIKIGQSVTQLKEVVVEGERSLVEEKVDRMIYNAENDQTARGGDAGDVLRRVPMLTVDMDGNVSLRGNQNVRVLINNKPSTITASSVADALKQIPADQIKSVEVITSPSAKYDAEGSAGIINIILKKSTMQGFTLNVDGTAGMRGSNLGLNANYRTGKMGFSLGGFGRSNYNVTGIFKNSQSSLDEFGNVTSTTSQQANTRNNGLFGNYNFGWDYDINKNNSLVAQVRLGARDGHTYQDGLYTLMTRINHADSASNRNVRTTDLSNNIDANLTYTHTFSTPGEEFSVMGSISRNNRTNNFINNIFGSDESTIASRIRNVNNSYNQEATLQVDYTKPIGKNHIIELGGKNIRRSVSSKYDYYTSIGEGDYILSPNSNLSNNLDYSQNVTAGYLSYTVSLPKGYSLKAGGRYEYTSISANLKDEQDLGIPSYAVLVPSANLSKKLKKGTLKLSYNRRIQRPSIQYLNPNVQQQNPYNITQGNPTLSPEYTNNYEFGYSTFLKGASLNTSLFVRNTNNAIQSVRDITDFNGNSNVVRTQYFNIGHEDAYGASVFTNVSISEKFTLNGGTDFYYAVLNNNNPDPKYSASNKGFVISGRMFGSYNLTKLWGLQFFGFYRGRQVNLQGFQGGFGIYSLSLKRDFANKKGSIGFGAENFFNFNGWKIRSESQSPVLIQNSTNVMHNLSFKVTFSFRFGKMNYDQQPRRSRRSINNDDLKEGGEGGGGGGMDNGGGQGGGFNAGGAGGNRGGQGGAQQRPQGQQQQAPAVNNNAPKADPAAVVDPVGTWTYTVESPQGGGGTIVIRKEGDAYTGTMTNNRFNRENQLKNVTMNGNEITFGYENSFNGNTNTVTVKATISGEALSGTMTVGQFGSFPINAKKNP
jgi:outer membrane receptor protein involved in Fe transport